MVKEISVPARVCANVWFLSFSLDQPTNPTIEVKGIAFMPNTQISAKIGPLTPAQ